MTDVALRVMINVNTPIVMPASAANALASFDSHACSHSTTLMLAKEPRMFLPW